MKHIKKWPCVFMIHLNIIFTLWLRRPEGTFRCYVYTYCV